MQLFWDKFLTQYSFRNRSSFRDVPITTVAILHPNSQWQKLSSVVQLYPTLCDPMDCSMPGLPVYHQHPEPTQTHVHCVGEAIHHLILCHPLLLLPSIFPSIRVFSKESLLHIRWPKYSASVLPMNIQDWFPLGWTGWISLQSKELSRVFSNTTVQKHQVFGAQVSLQSNSHIHTWLLEKL